VASAAKPAQSTVPTELILAAEPVEPAEPVVPAEPIVPVEPAVTGKTVTPAAIPTAGSGKAVAQAAPSVPPTVVESIVGLVGASGQGKSNADQERYRVPHDSAEIHRSLRSL
jgi:hypothetical protein